MVQVKQFGYNISSILETRKQDRDDFINIIKDNVRDDEFNQNYRKHDGIYNARGTIYDYRSIMHYPKGSDSAIGDPKLPNTILE